MKKPLATCRVAGFIALIVTLSSSYPGTRGVAAQSTVQSSPVAYIEGPINSEDLVLIPNTRWVIASGMSRPPGLQGHLYLVNARDRSWETIYPRSGFAARHDAVTYPDCSSPPRQEAFSAHGLNLRPLEDGRFTLYVVSHNARESVEVFDVDARYQRPMFTWVGCVIVPKTIWPNAVVPLPAGGFAITSTFDPTTEQGEYVGKMSAGQPTGVVAEWHAGAGWRLLSGTALSGNNGIVLSSDRERYLVNAWSGKSITLILRRGVPKIIKRVQVDFLPDNLRWSGKRLLVAGQVTSASELLRCAFSSVTFCSDGYVVAEIDPGSLAAREIIRSPGSTDFGVASTALIVGDEIWLGTFRGTKIAIFSLRK